MLVFECLFVCLKERKEILVPMVGKEVTGAVQVPGGKENASNGSAPTCSGNGRERNSGNERDLTSGGGAGSGPGSGSAAGGNPNDGDGDEESSDEDEDEAEDEEIEDADDEEEEDQDGPDAGAGDGDTVASSNPGSPAASTTGNWKSYETLMKETYPSKSKTLYLSAYVEFEKFLKAEKQFVADVVPAEVSFLNYFDYLKSVKHWASTTIWSHYSRLNAVLKRKFGVSLKNYPSVTDLLKAFSVGHRLKKSAVFTPQQVI